MAHLYMALMWLGIVAGYLLMVAGLVWILVAKEKDIASYYTDMWTDCFDQIGRENER